MLNIGENTFLQKSDIEYAIKVFLYGCASFLVGFHFIIQISKKLIDRVLNFLNYKIRKFLL